MASKPKSAAAAAAAPAPDGPRRREEEESKAPSALPLKRIILAVIGIAVLGGGGFGGYTFLFAHGDHHDAAPAVKPSVFVDLPEVLGQPVQYRRRPYPISQGQGRARTARPAADGADPAGDAAGARHLRDLSARVAADRSRRILGPLPAQGGADRGASTRRLRPTRSAPSCSRRSWFNRAAWLRTTIRSTRDALAAEWGMSLEGEATAAPEGDAAGPANDDIAAQWAAMID